MLRAVPRSPLEVASPSTFAPALLRLVAVRGGDASLLASQVGLAEKDLELDELSVTPSSLASLVRGACDQLADPHAALRFPFEVPMRRYDAVALALRSARTAREVLTLTMRYAPLVFPQLEVSIEERDGELRFGARVQGHPRGLGIGVDELVLGFVVGHARRGGALVVPRRAWLTSARPRSLEPLLFTLETTDLAFGCEDTGLAIDVATADRELPGADPLMLVTAEQLADAALARAPRAGAFASTVGTRIEALLTSDPSVEAIAAALKMSPRTLQRRLEDEGTRFSSVLELARERVARRGLDDRARSLGEVAFQTGFADLASFSRAFKKWTGIPPGAYRRRV